MFSIKNSSTAKMTKCEESEKQKFRQVFSRHKKLQGNPNRD